MASRLALAPTPAPPTYYLSSATDSPPDGFGVLSIDVRKVDNGAVLVLNGELDRATAESVRRAVGAAVAAGSSTLVLDMRGVSYLDSAGVNVLADAQEEAEAGGVVFGVGALSPQVTRLLSITNRVKTIVLP